MRILVDESRVLSSAKGALEAQLTRKVQALTVMRQRLRLSEDKLETALHTISKNEERLEQRQQEPRSFAVPSSRLPPPSSTQLPTLPTLSTLVKSQSEAMRWLHQAVEAQEAISASMSMTQRAQERSRWTGPLLEASSMALEVPLRRYESRLEEANAIPDKEPEALIEAFFKEPEAAAAIILHEGELFESLHDSRRASYNDLPPAPMQPASPLQAQIRALEAASHAEISSSDDDAASCSDASCSPKVSPTTVKVKSLASSIAAMRAGKAFYDAGKPDILQSSVACRAGQVIFAIDDEEESEIEIEAVSPVPVPEVLTPDVPSPDCESPELDNAYAGFSEASAELDLLLTSTGATGFPSGAAAIDETEEDESQRGVDVWQKYAQAGAPDEEEVAEISSSSAMIVFDSIDDNHDGVIDRKEFTDHFRGKTLEGYTPPEPLKKPVQEEKATLAVFLVKEDEVVEEKEAATAAPSMSWGYQAATVDSSSFSLPPMRASTPTRQSNKDSGDSEDDEDSEANSSRISVFGTSLTSSSRKSLPSPSRMRQRAANMAQFLYDSPTANRASPAPTNRPRRRSIGEDDAALAEMVRSKHLARRKKDGEQQQELRQLEGEIEKLSGGKGVASSGLIVHSVAIMGDAPNTITSPTTA